ncbi:MAG: amino acid ABC transporter permease [Lachnospiraceae bacterium]
MEFFNVLVQYFPSFCVALGETIKLTIISLLCASVLGVIFGMFKVSGLGPLKLIANIYIDIIRGTPLMVQTMIVFYGLSQVMRPFGFSWSNMGGAFTAGAVTLSLNAGAYMAEIIRGGIEAVDKGQMEAARSLGLPYSKSMSKVILPQAFRTMMPSIINQFIISLKDTSLISVIGIRELTQNGKIIAANSASRVMVIWLVVALFYMVICTFLSRVAIFVERRVSYAK